MVGGDGQGGGGRRWVVALVWRRRCGIHALRQLREAHEGKVAQTKSGYKGAMGCSGERTGKGNVLVGGEGWRWMVRRRRRRRRWWWRR